MTLGELEGVGKLLAHHPLKGDKLWSKSVADITEFDICLFYARSGIERKYLAAKLVQSIQDFLISSAYLEKSSNLPYPFLMHEIPEEPFYVDQFIEGLEKLSTQTRMATIFSLESKIEPSRVALLTWKMTTGLNGLNQIGEEVLEKTRLRKHPRIPYVFWEKTTPTLTTPLFDLSKRITNAFDMDWAKLLYSYTNMVPICREVESKLFMAHLNKQ